MALWSGLVSVSVSFFLLVFVSISVSVSAHENRLRDNWGGFKSILIAGVVEWGRGSGNVWSVESRLIYIFLVSNLCQMRALIDDQHRQSPFWD